MSLASKIREWLGLGYYVSPLDQFLEGFDKTHPKSSISQEAEIRKYERIFRLRDYPSQVSAEKTFWDQF